MNILMVHQNFPGQFRSLALALAARGDRVVALRMSDGVMLPEIETIRTVLQGAASTAHPWVQDFESKVIRGQATLDTAQKLAASGFDPDVIIAHPSWGESLFLKHLWPEVPYGIYCEYFYSARGADADFDPEFPSADQIGQACRIDLRNLAARWHFELADAAIAPTRWQAETYPKPLRDRIEVIHDGIDTDMLRPDPAAAVQIGDTLPLDRNEEVITFVSRNLEPYRGYHVLMRALPELLARRRNAHVLIVGGNGVGYGAAPPPGQTWMGRFYQEVRDRIDPARVHFLGKISHARYRAVLQLSTVHLYLTYPFVLSWSLLEAMSVGCAIVASDTPPVREVISHGITGRLVDFFDTEGLVDNVCALLDSPGERARLGCAARARMVESYDIATIILPRQLAWVDALAAIKRR